VVGTPFHAVVSSRAAWRAPARPPRRRAPAARAWAASSGRARPGPRRAGRRERAPGVASRPRLWQDARAAEPVTPTVTLIRHPAAEAPAVRGVTASVARRAGDLTVEFALAGDLDALAIPPAGPPAPGARLWEHTCFEVFVAAGGAGYHELNLAPSGAWQAHAFARYREGGPLADPGLAPRIDVARDARRLTLRAELALGRLAGVYRAAPLRLALAAVVEDRTGARSWWALRHPPGRPDFHHPDGFALGLDAAAPVEGPPAP